MKRILSFIGCLSSTVWLGAQTASTGNPIGWSAKISTTQTAIYRLPKIDNEERKNYYEKQASLSDYKVLQYGEPHEVSLPFFTHAEKKQLPNGSLLWQLRIQSNGAHSMNVIFSKFNLAEGSLLYLYDSDRKKYVGAYTSLNNNKVHELGTDLLYASDMIIELWEPAENIGKSTLEIGSLIHGFIHLGASLNKSLNSSGSCNIDVNCPQGSGWEICRNSVAMILNASGGMCTGTLVDNTAHDGKPYFLTANHCGLPSSAGSWVYRFRWESPAAQADCGTSTLSVNGPEDMNINGGTSVANSAPNDFNLIELNNKPDPAWEVIYAGWDRSLTPTPYSAGIHHPSGDIKKISLSFNACTSTTYTSLVNGHWKAFWSDGVTEPGSSGSPLFNSSRRVIGQLSGGASSCGGIDLSDAYGKFNLSWEGGGTPTTRLKDWLDPSNSNANFLDANVQNTLDPFLYPKVIGLQEYMCNGEFSGSIAITNGGKTNLTSATINYSIDGIQFTYNWTGNLSLFQTDTIVLPSIPVGSGVHIFSATVVNPNNGQTDDVLINNSFQQSFSNIVSFATYELEMNLDCFAAENSWEILDQNNNIRFKSPDYLTTNSPYTMTHTVCLEDGCYKFKIYDSYGDGMSSGNCQAGSYVFSDLSSGDILFEMNQSQANFGFSKTTNFCVAYSTLEEENSNDFKIYPNPFNNEMSVHTTGDLIKNVRVFDLSGKLVFEQNAINKADYTFENEWVNGVYQIQIQTDKHVLNRKVIKINPL